jgi:hypothetical protein
MKKAAILYTLLFCCVFLQLTQAAETAPKTKVFTDSLILNCPPPTQILGDTTDNNCFLWNQNYYWDAITNTHDLCERPVDLSITATGPCLGAGTQIQYLLFLDLNGDDSTETVVNSATLGNAGLGWNNVWFGNASYPNYTGGTPYKFDGTAIPTNQLYGFALKITGSGSTLTAAVRWNTKSNQSQYDLPQLPYGKHHIKWIIRDNCGHEKTCTYYFQVKDTKKPTIVCIPPLSVNIKSNTYPPSIEIWAADYLQYTLDNCTPPNRLKIAYRLKGQGTGFPLDTLGNPITRHTFDCDEIGVREVELWSIDLAGNANFCNSKITINDNNFECGGDPITFFGHIFTEHGDPVQSVNVDVNVSGNQIPAYSSIVASNVIGLYNFNFAPGNATLKITPFKDDNPLNGVSTYDLVLMSKHILGLDTLDSPYKMIAADVNRSNSVTTFDIVEARKMILGIYTAFPNNTSWRFVDQSFAFPNAINPFQTTFAEKIIIPSLDASTPKPNFFAIKTGDVNGNAIASGAISPEARTNASLSFTTENHSVKAGENFTLHLTASERVQAYQFTLHFQNLTLLNVQPLSKDMDLGNFGIFEQALTTSYNGEEAGKFDLTFRALADGKISDFLYLSDDITPSAAYQQDQRMAVNLKFDGPVAGTTEDLGFTVCQNQPNPFDGQTRIGFYLPYKTSAKKGLPAFARASAGEPTEAILTTLKIFDLIGNVIYTQQSQFQPGYQQFTLNSSDLPIQNTALLLYQVETIFGSITKKMIVIK